jgi:hypothetical protein
MTAEEVIAVREAAARRLNELFERHAAEMLRTTSGKLSGRSASGVIVDDFMDAPKYAADYWVEPSRIRNMNANQRRKKFRHLLKKWESQIAVHQVKARLNGKIARTAESLAFQMETADQERRRTTLQALRASRSVSQTRP